MATFVYIIKSGQFAKIGYSKQPERRLRQFQIILPEPASIVATFPGGVDLENKLHRYLAQYHLHDEWFRWCDPLARIVSDGLPDLSRLPKGSPFYPGRRSAEYASVRVDRLERGLAHGEFNSRRSL